MFKINGLLMCEREFSQLVEGNQIKSVCCYHRLYKRLIEKLNLSNKPCSLSRKIYRNVLDIRLQSTLPPIRYISFPKSMVSRY